MTIRNTAYNRQRAKREGKRLVCGRMITPRGTARRLRREAAKSIFPAGRGFSIYWNGGKPSSTSLQAAIKHREEHAA